MYITRSVSFACIIPRRRIKLGKRGAKRTFSNHAWFARWLTRLKEEEKKKRDDDNKWNCKSIPFHYLPISACLELLEWTLGDLINHVFGSKSQGRTLLVFDWQSDYSSRGFDFEASTLIQEFCFNTPEMWLRKWQQKPNSLWQASSRKRKEKKKENEREKEQKKKKRLLTSPKPSVNFVFPLPLCVHRANLFELRFVSDFIYT